MPARTVPPEQLTGGQAPFEAAFARMARQVEVTLGDVRDPSTRVQLFRSLPLDPMAWLMGQFPTYFQSVAGEPVPLAPHQEEFWQWLWALRPGVAQHTFIAIWPRGGGKCLAEGTQVACADGRRVAVQNLQVGDEILSFNEETGRMEPDQIMAQWEQGFQPCLRLRTRTNKVLTLTGDHRVLTFAGWKKASELTLQDRIASPRRLPLRPAPETHTDEEVRFTAYMIAEGGMSQPSIRFTSADPVIVADFYACAAQMGFDVAVDTNRHGYRLRPLVPPRGPRRGILSPVRQWVQANGLNHLAIHKRMPAWVFALPERQKWMFLAALIDTDGWIEVERGRVNICLANEKLIEDIGYLFLQVGVCFRSWFKPNTKHNAWTLQIDQECVARCLEQMPLRLKGEKLRQACATPRYSLLDTYPRSMMRGLPFGVNRWLRDTHGLRVGQGTYHATTRAMLRKILAVYPHERWQWLEQADVYWDEITSIEEVGLYATYDVEVAKNHNLVSNQLITHNSTSTELGAAAVGYFGLRRYGLYVSSVQKQADDHVANVASALELLGVERAVNRYGFSRGWSINRLRTAEGFTLDAIGMDAAVRGVRIEEARPDLILLDDLDDELDSLVTIAKKVSVLTQKILPTGAGSLAVVGVQNLPSKDGIFAQLADGRAEYLMDRHLSGPHPALRDLPETDWYEQFRAPSGRLQFRITAGTPVWAGQDLPACERLLNLMGVRSFLIECQHKIALLESELFRREWFPLVTDWPREAQLVRYWDFASTEVKPGTDPDWTVGLLVGLYRGQFWVIDMQRMRGTPEKVEQLVRATAHLDGRPVPVWLEEEGGSSGKIVTSDYRLRVLVGFSVYTWHSTGSKAERAKPVSSAAEAGNVLLVKGYWNNAFLDEIGQFGIPGVHDDIVDSLSGAHYALTLGGGQMPQDMDMKRGFEGLTMRAFAQRATDTMRVPASVMRLWAVDGEEEWL